MKIKHAPQFALFSLLLSLHAQPARAIDAPPPPPPPLLSVDPTGSFVLDGIPFTLAHYDHQWIRTTLSALKPDPAATVPHVVGTWTVHGTLPIKDKSLSLDGQITRSGDRQYHLLYKATLADGLPTEVVAIEMDLPISQAAGKQILVDGQALTLPTDSVAAQHLLMQKAAKLIVPSSTGIITVEGNLDVYVQDERQWNGDTYKIRLELAHDDLTTATGPISAQSDLTLTYTPAAVAK
jgi:hypothetical protein